jgi:hypothetical protein
MHFNLVTAPLLFIGIFLLVRRFWWWYFGIGRALELLEDIAVSLRTMPTVQRYDQTMKRKPPRAA